MTNHEAAIKIFTIKHDPAMGWTQESIAALEMAISALQAQEIDAMCKEQWAKDKIEELPAEIILCNDCRHNKNSREAGNADCKLFYGMTDQYGFCHRAERRADESD